MLSDPNREAGSRGDDEFIDLLARDRDLGRQLAEQGARPPNGALKAPLMHLDRGPWKAEAPAPRGDHLGFLVLEGLIGRRCFVPDRGRSLELLGRGDLLRPWQEDPSSFSQVSWTVFERSSVAVLGGSLVASARDTPGFLEVLTERALRRSRRLAISAAIANTVGVEDRILLVLWLLAELWGENRPEGALIPYRLSHQTLADLVGARRPTVTLAVRALTGRRLIDRAGSGEWIVLGSPP